MKKIIKSDNVYKGKVVDLYVDELEYGGMFLKREVVRHSGGAGVLVEKDEKFAFVRQYRHPFGCEFVEIPAGKRDNGESGEQTAYRELIEECGLKAKKLHFICEYSVSPGYTDEVLYLYYANDFEQTSQRFDDDESLVVEWVDKRECLQMALDGQIKDGKTLICLLWYLNRFEK